MSLPTCRECQEPSCTCHPDATHKHYRSTKAVNGTFWHEYRGHSHSMILDDPRADEGPMHCVHDGCTHTARLSPIPVMLVWR